MDRYVELEVNGKRVRGVVVRRVYAREHRRKIGGKEYVWCDYYITTGIPKSFVGKTLVVIALEDSELLRNAKSLNIRTDEKERSGAVDEGNPSR